MERIRLIQQELNCPKTLHNSFGNYNYRSAETILEAVKPLLAKNKLSMIVTDSIESVGERVYVKATATIFDDTGKQLVQTSAFARESENKKGQDDSQITGATSSYARKYALNGLFLIDDSKDADSDEFTKGVQEQIESFSKTDRMNNLPIYNKPETKKETKVEAKTKVTL